MGAACNSFCGKQETLTHTQPDTESIKARGTATHDISAIETSIPSETQTDSERVDHQQAASRSQTSPQYDVQEVLIELRNAVRDENETLITFLLEEHTDSDILNTVHMNQTVLQYAVINHQYAMIKYLLENGANPDIQNEQGQTALHLATLKGDVKAVEILCDHNADKSMKNENDETAIDIAIDQDTKHHRDILFILEPNKRKLLKLKQKSSASNVDRLTATNAADWADSILSDSPNLAAPSNADLNAPMTTVRLGGVVDDLFQDIQDDFKKSNASLHGISAWLDKKQASPPYSWMKRWVVVHDRYLLWSDMRLSIETEHIDAKEKKRWNKCVPLAKVSNVEQRKDKKNRVFAVSVKERDYLFRAKDEATRDEWIQNLKDNLEFLEKAKDFHISPSFTPMSHHSAD